MRIIAIEKSVKDMCNHIHLDDMIMRVCSWMRNVLILINKAKSKNNLVE